MVLTLAKDLSVIMSVLETKNKFKIIEMKKSMPKKTKTIYNRVSLNYISKISWS